MNLTSGETSYYHSGTESFSVNFLSGEQDPTGQQPIEMNHPAGKRMVRFYIFIVS